jgi:AcrR family transcriptional regulator
MPRPRSNIDKRIVRAARKRFLAKGVDGASLRDIARAAGTSIGMVYYYFPTKDDLFEAVVEEVYEALLADLARAFAKDLPIPERLRRLSVRIAETSPTELEVMRLVVREALTSSRRRERLLSRAARGHVAMLMQTVSDGIAQGVIDDAIHPVVMMMCAWGVVAVPQVMRRVLVAQMPGAAVPEPQELATALVDVLFGGIAPHKHTRASQGAS